MSYSATNARRARLRDEDARLYRLVNTELCAYLDRKAAEVAAKGGDFDFPAKMIAAIAQWGGLTDNQKAAVERMMARDAERAVNRALPRTPRGVDVSKITECFDRARAAAAADGEGIKMLHLRMANFVCSPAPAHGKNPGAIYVKEDGAYLGKIVDGQFHRSQDCSGTQEDRLAEVAKDPSAAARAYGLRTGQCSICGRELTNAESRARGIGPICAGRFGFL